MWSHQSIATVSCQWEGPGRGARRRPQPGPGRIVSFGVRWNLVRSPDRRGEKMRRLVYVKRNLRREDTESLGWERERSQRERESERERDRDREREREIWREGETGRQTEIRRPVGRIAPNRCGLYTQTRCPALRRRSARRPDPVRTPNRRRARRFAARRARGRGRRH